MSVWLSRRARVRTLLAAGVVLISGTAAVGHAAQSGGPLPAGPGDKSVSYLGHAFTVPASWPVVDLADHPTACVRFDVHAVYLGVPGPHEDCPARVVGPRTEAVLVEPARSAHVVGSATDAPVDHVAAHEIDASGGGVSVTATYGADRARAQSILAGAAFAAPVPVRPAVPAAATVPHLHPHPQPPPQQRSAPLSPRQRLDGVIYPEQLAVSSYVAAGLGFDSCAAPSQATMQAWAASPFDAIGIYVGGRDRGCAQPNLTAAWVSATARAGWKFMPLYVGPQAAFGELGSPATQAAQAADDAIAQVTSLGFGLGTLIYYDMESYAPAQRKAAMAFVSAWDAELAAKGYRSAVYSSASTGINDLVADVGKIVEPSVVSIAQWNNLADTDPTATPATAWPSLRVHQFAGGSLPGGGPDTPSYGGVGINIDRDFLDVEDL